MFNQLRALCAGHNQRRWNLRAIGAGNCVRPHVVTAIRQWSIDFSQHRGALRGIRTHNNAVGIKKICDRSPFAKKLRIRCDVELLSLGAISQNNFSHPIAGVNRYRALLDHHLVTVDRSGYPASHRLHIRKIGLAVFRRRSPNSYKNGRTRPYRSFQIIRKFQPDSAVTVQQLGQKFFVNWNLATVQRRQLLLVIVHNDDVVPQVCETSTGD